LILPPLDFWKALFERTSPVERSPPAIAAISVDPISEAPKAEPPSRNNGLESAKRLLF